MGGSGASSRVTGPRLGADTRGANLVEYILLVGLVAALALGGYRTFGDAAHGKIDGQAACVTSLACTAGAAAAPGTMAAPGDGTMPPIQTGAQAVKAQGEAPAGKSLATRALDVGKGIVVDGLWGTVTGLWGAVTHPIETVKGLGHAVAHPIDTGGAIKDAVVKAWDENPERVIGAAVFEIATAPVAALKATKAGKVAKLTKVARVVEEADDVADAAKVARRAQEASKAAGVARKVDEAEDVAKTAAKVAKAKFTLSEEEFVRMAREGGLEPERMRVYRFDSRPPETIAHEGGLFPNPAKPAAKTVQEHFGFGETGSSTFVSTTYQEANNAFVVGSDAPKTLVGMTEKELIERMETRLPSPDAAVPPPVEYVIYEDRAETMAAKTNATGHVHEQEALTRGISVDQGLEVREVRVRRPWKKVGVEDWEPGDTVSIALDLPKRSTVEYGGWRPVGGGVRR